MRKIRNTIIGRVLRTAVAIGFVLTSAAAVILARDQSTPEDRSTLLWRVREAKKLGKTSIELDVGEGEHAATQSLDVALEDTSLVLAEVIKSEADHDERGFHLAKISVTREAFFPARRL
jgi:hypothetical protein